MLNKESPAVKNLYKQAKAKKFGVHPALDDFHDFIEIDFRKFYFYKEEDVTRFAELYFDKILFIKGYQAIYRKDENIIEARLSQENVDFRSIFDYFSKQTNENLLFKEQNNVMGLKISEGQTITIETVNESSCLYFLTALQQKQPEDRTEVRRFDLPPILVLCMKGFVFESEDTGNVLENVGFSFLFQLDYLYGFSSFVLGEHRKPEKKEEISNIVYPSPIMNISYVYEKEPFYIYMSAKKIEHYPLLKYLTFYQSLEFYYTKFSNLKIQKMLLDLFKTPSLSYHIEENIVRLSSNLKQCIERSKELSILKEVLSSIPTIQVHEIKSFLGSEGMQRLYKEQGQKILNKNLVQKTEKQSDKDLLNLIGDRIYNIRCRIVHSKEDSSENEDQNSSNKPIFLFSEESFFMDYDLLFIEFIAKQVIASNAVPNKMYSKT